MKNILTTFAVATILLSTICQVHAQVLGERVRVTEHSGTRTSGIVVDRSETALTIGFANVAGATRQIAFADMQAIRISLGEQTQAKAGLIIGAAGGVLIMVSVCGAGCGVSAGLIGGGILVTGLTGLIGGAAGRMIKTQQWTEVPIPGRAAATIEPLVSVRPTGQLVVGARLTF